VSSVERSLIRYVALALGDEWEVRPTGGSPADEFARPFCRVGPSTPATSTPHGARHLLLRQSFAAVAFPAVGQTPEASALEASRVERLLLLAFAQGIDPAAYSSRSGRAHPLRVPLFDYAGVPWGVPVPEDARAGFARVIDGPEVQAAADGADPRMFVVALDFRLEWSQYIGRDLSGPVLQSVTARGTGG
jgi:hypothetical protein